MPCSPQWWEETEEVRAQPICPIGGKDDFVAYIDANGSSTRLLLMDNGHRGSRTSSFCSQGAGRGSVAANHHNRPAPRLCGQVRRRGRNRIAPATPTVTIPRKVLYRRQLRRF